MARGNPVEFVRQMVNGVYQRIGNEMQQQGFPIEPDHTAESAAGADAEIVLEMPGVGFRWRFDYIHYSYDSEQKAAGGLEIDDGATIELFYIVGAEGELHFCTTLWAEDSQVTITLLSGGGGVTCSLAVHGVRRERVRDDAA